MPPSPEWAVVRRERTAGTPKGTGAARRRRKCVVISRGPRLCARDRGTSRLGGRGPELSSHPFDGSASVSEPEGLPVACRANGVAVSVETSAGSEKPFVSDNGFAGDVSILPVPLGRMVGLPH